MFGPLRSSRSNFGKDSRERVNHLGDSPLKRESLLNGNNFGSYIQINDEYYSNNNQKLGIHHDSTCSRNKVAFFKDSLVIVKDKNVEIAFRKSNLNPDLNEQTVAFFIKNKTADEIEIDIDYKNYGGDYRIDVEEKVKSIKGFSQER